MPGRSEKGQKELTKSLIKVFPLVLLHFVENSKVVIYLETFETIPFLLCFGLLRLVFGSCFIVFFGVQVVKMISFFR